MKKVLLIDSGSGGVNVLKECVRVVPCCDYLFFCDNVNMPYGNKTKRELQMLTMSNLKRIYSFFKFDIVIFACNTITSTCIEICRKKFKNVIFIGTVPAIKPALEKFDAKDVLVIATKSTIKNNKTILKHKGEGIQLKPMTNLASRIDEKIDRVEELEGELRRELKGIRFKAIVLGCTHYLAIALVLKKIYPNVQIFDGANGVARRLKSFIDSKEQDIQVQFMVSGDSSFLNKLWWLYNK